MNVFFITGLPRSRTAWLANFMTHRSSFCFHERLKDCARPQDLAYHLRTAEARHHLFVGDSDSILPLHAPKVIEQFPEARWIIVWRDATKAALSYVKYFGAQRYVGQDYPKMAEVEHKMAELTRRLGQIPHLMAKENLLEVTFGSLERESILESIWNHCTRGMVQFDRERARLLQTLRVQVIPEKVSFLSQGKDRERVSGYVGKWGNAPTPSDHPHTHSPTHPLTTP